MFLLFKYLTAETILGSSKLSPVSTSFIVIGELTFSFKVLLKNSFLLSKIRLAKSGVFKLAFIAPSIGVSVILKKFK
jgi:hypothetical protein